VKEKHLCVWLKKNSANNYEIKKMPDKIKSPARWLDSLFVHQRPFLFRSEMKKRRSDQIKTLDHHIHKA